jgi:hypothetical protein
MVWCADASTEAASACHATATAAATVGALDRLFLGRALVLSQVLISIRLVAAGLVLPLLRGRVLGDASPGSTRSGAGRNGDLDAG